MEKDSAYYIGWRSGLMGVTAFGEPGVNTDDRFWNYAGAPFALSMFSHGDTLNYAVSDADAEVFIGKVLRRSEEDARGPKPSSGSAAVVRIGMNHYPFHDGALMKEWLEELRSKCGQPLSKAEFYNYTHPAPLPPEGAVEVTKIVEQAVLPYRSPAVLGPGPDNCRSELLAEGDFAVLSLFQNGMHLEYRLPPELLPEVNAAARAMLDHPGDGYHAEGDADAWLKIKGREEEFNARPEDVLKLFESLAGRCGDPIPRSDIPDFYKVWLPGVRDRLAGAWDCPLCAWKRNTAEFCEGCGAKREDIPSGRAVSAPKEKAPVPWACLRCGTQGNTGGYCCHCGSPGNMGERWTGVSGPIGYRKGESRSIFHMAGFLGSFPPAQTPPPPAPAAPAAPGEWFCPMCGARNSGKFCTECGVKKRAD